MRRSSSRDSFVLQASSPAGPAPQGWERGGSEILRVQTVSPGCVLGASGGGGGCKGAKGALPRSPLALGVGREGPPFPRRTRRPHPPGVAPEGPPFPQGIPAGQPEDAGVEGPSLLGWGHGASWLVRVGGAGGPGVLVGAPGASGGSGSSGDLSGGEGAGPWGVRGAASAAGDGERGGAPEGPSFRATPSASGGRDGDAGRLLDGGR